MSWGWRAAIAIPPRWSWRGSRRLREFFNKLGLPAAMSALGIDEAKLELMAKKATGEAYGAEHSLGGLENLGWRNKHD